MASVNNNELFIKYVKEGNCYDIHTLFRNSDININYQDNEGKTALHYATKTLNTYIVNILLESEADPNIQDNRGRTPLFEICMYGCINIAKKLIKKGANINIADKYGETILDLATSVGDIYFVELLLQNGVDLNIGNPLGNAISEGRFEFVKLFVEHGADIHKKYTYSSYAIYDASLYYEKNSEILYYLLEKGVDVNVQNNYGDTPLLQASFEGYFELVRILLNNGADPRIKNTANKDAIDLAKTDEIKKYILDFEKIIH